MILKILRILDWLTRPVYFIVGYFRTRKSIPKITNPILTTSAIQLAKKIRVGELACEEVVTAFIERCKEVNPIVNAIIEDRFEEAIEDARNADNFLRTSNMTASQLEHEKPLLGVPITIKESCALKGMSFSAGVERYKNHKVSYNGDAVQLLLNAGAIPIAVTSTPAYCLWIETFNSIIGYTSNPYDSRKTTGGSSGGEAALIASAASVLGLGSDAGGSIRIPAGFCGIYGHKSSNGMVSAKGHATFFANQQILDMVTVGPLCRYAADLELAMSVLSAGKLSKCSSLCLTVDLQQINVFYLFEYKKSIFSVDPIIKNKISKAVGFFKEEYGCRVKQMETSEFEKIFEIMSTHFQTITSYISEEKNIQEVNSENTLKKCLDFIHNSSFKFLWKTNQELYTRQRTELQIYLLKSLASNGVLLMPVWPESAFYKYQSISKIHNTCYNYFVNLFGLTSTVVPIGFDGNNMPLSIQVIAAPNQDRICLTVAKELDKLYGGWTPP